MLIDHHRIVDDSLGGIYSTQQMQHVRSCSTTGSNTMNELNLSLVNEAYGNHADLYLHVLRVKPNAASAQIQEAYFDRRNELFQILSQMNIAQTGSDDNKIDDNDDQQQYLQYNTERKMDAVVCAVRILGDPDLRLQYDDIRTERTRLYNQQIRNAVPHGAASPNSTMSGRTITHKNLNYNGAVSPSSMLLPSLHSMEAVPDVMSSTATASTTDNNNDQTNMSTTFLDYFSVHESMNISNYLETTINSYYSTVPDDTAAAMAGKVDSDNEYRRPLSLSASNVPSSKLLSKNEHYDDAPVPNPPSRSSDDKSSLLALSSTRRPINPPRSHARMTSKPPLRQQRLPVDASTAPTLPTTQTLQRRVGTNETVTTYGDGSIEQLSQDSTLYYDDDEDDTYYTIDYEDEDDEDDSFVPRRRRSKTTRKNRCNYYIDPVTFSCLDHGIDRIRGEMLDAIDDAVIAFEQVLNVFTIQEEDILAVTSRIEKAKRQMANTHFIYPHSIQNTNGRNNAEYVSGDNDEEGTDDYDIGVPPKKSSYYLKRRKAKPFLLPPPPSSSSTRRNRKAKP